MTWLQIISLGGIIGTFLGIGVAVAAYFNGKHIKEGVGKITELIKETQNLVVKTQNLIVEETQETRKILEKIYEKVA